jgi:uncharacterized protein YbaR (Trm112 family)
MADRGKGTELGKWVDDLVCPVCFGELRFPEASVVCAGCGRSYPIVDGIPVLIADRATTRSSR